MAAPPPKVPEGTYGPHSSKLANAADPRVDSDLDSARTAQTGNTVTDATATTTTGKPVTGYDDPEGTHGPHASRVANAADPRVDSDADHRAAGTGVAQGVSGAGYAPGVTPGTSTHASTTEAPGHVQGGPAAHLSGAAGTTGTTTTTTTTGTGTNTGERVAEGIKGSAHGLKGILAQGHGVGESLRGNINSAIDSLTGDTAKQAQDEETARRGFREVEGKQFERKV